MDDTPFDLLNTPQINAALTKERGLLWQVI